MSVQLFTGDCREVLRTLADNSVDSVVTDPPYGLKFMGKRWDYDVPTVEVWVECLRVLKPGGYLLAFAGTRTQHRMAVRIEDAGFEIRDMIAWVYGSGFPKSHNGEWGGTALKPALEPITMARKPLIGTVEHNWREYGTGPLNIDPCRVPTEDKLGGGNCRPESIGKFDNDGWKRPWMSNQDALKAHAEKMRNNVERAEELGRWPANFIHDGSDEVVQLFPVTQSGLGAAKRASSSDGHGNAGAAFGAESRPSGTAMITYGDTGSAARFFYCAKASRSDRSAGLDNPGPQFKQGTTLRKVQTTETKGNHHPTVKPTDLMRYLCRLVTPVGGVVLDPFMGSGSTGRGAVLEGCKFIGIELDDDGSGSCLGYVAIARSRIAAAVSEREAESEAHAGEEGQLAWSFAS